MSLYLENIIDKKMSGMFGTTEDLLEYLTLTETGSDNDFEENIVKFKKALRRCRLSLPDVSFMNFEELEETFTRNGMNLQEYLSDDLMALLDHH